MAELIVDIIDEVTNVSISDQVSSQVNANHSTVTVNSPGIAATTLEVVTSSVNIAQQATVTVEKIEISTIEVSGGIGATGLPGPPGPEGPPGPVDVGLMAALAIALG